MLGWAGESGSEVEDDDIDIDRLKWPAVFEGEYPWLMGVPDFDAVDAGDAYGDRVKRRRGLWDGDTVKGG